MNKLTIFLLGISSLLLCNCSNVNRNSSEKSPDDGDTLCADPPFGYVVELKPLGNFSRKETELLREEFIEQLHAIFSKNKKDLEASVYIGENENMLLAFINRETDIGQEKY